MDKVRVGYACIPVTIGITTNRGCSLKNASDEKLRFLIKSNIDSLKELLLYNIEKNIYVFRISSDIIPFGSHPVNKIKWWEEERESLEEIGYIIKHNKVRVSMHPGQYTVLNSKDYNVFNNSINDLNYHSRFMDSLNVDSTNKLVIHVGGAYGDKRLSMKRFIERYHLLNENVKNRLIIENDEKMFNLDDVLEISYKTGAPVVFDILHNEINPSTFGTDINKIIINIKNTWKNKDGRMKIHFSNKDPIINKKTGAHSLTIFSKNFADFISSTSGLDMDIMLEVKDKDISAFKCYNLLKNNPEKKDIEEEWARYKYLIMEKNYNCYKEICELMDNLNKIPEKDKQLLHDFMLIFYGKIEQCIYLKNEKTTFINTASHIAGYFKDDKKFIRDFTIKLEKYKNGELSPSALKNILYREAVLKNNKYIINSYYFSASSIYNNIP